MAGGTKSTEFPQGTTAPSASGGDEFLMNVSSGTQRVAMSKIPQIGNLLLFVLSGESVTLSEAVHFGRTISVNNATADVAITLPGVTTVLLDAEDEDGDTVRRGGHFCRLVVGSNLFDVSITAGTSGEMRASNGPFGATLESDTVYVGASRDKGDEAVVDIYKRGNFWVLDCNRGMRAGAADDDAPASFTTNDSIAGGDHAFEIVEETTAAREIGDSDHEIPIWLTNAGPTALTFQSDIAVGGRFTVINLGSNAASITAGSHTLTGDSSIGASQAATILVGPTVSGDNRNIFVAASS